MALPSSTSHTPTSTNAPFPVGNIPGEDFVDRRAAGSNTRGRERRQFGSSHNGLSAAGQELALAIDEYKVRNHRRYITCDEMLSVLTRLGYQKTS